MQSQKQQAKPKVEEDAGGRLEKTEAEKPRVAKRTFQVSSFPISLTRSPPDSFPCACLHMKD